MMALLGLVSKWDRKSHHRQPTRALQYYGASLDQARAKKNRLAINAPRF